MQCGMKFGEIIMLSFTKDDILGGIVLGIFAFGWIDTLWIFGIENSQHYTWWGLMYYLGN